nr:uncharacterized protein LOC120967018 [Aegilops tauschii subsp. strangulata]
MFANLRKINLKLNPEKCVFGIPSGKLLGFFVSHRWIKANPNKIKAIEQIQAPKTVKDIRRLSGCIAALRSATLVAQREVEEASATSIVPSGEESEHTPERSDADQDTEEQSIGGSPKVAAKKKVVQRQVHFVSSLL